MECTRNQKRGFTLIELMVVILIIAILATLATMAGSSAIRAAKQARIKTELDNIAGQIEVYKSEYGSYPPNTTVRLRQHLQQKFPRAKSQDLLTLPNDLTPAEVLWVCLRGWTADPQRPVDFFNPSAKRNKPFGFEEGRLRLMRSWTHNRQTMTPLANGWPSEMPVYSYVPQIGKGPLETAPYVYFDCSRTGYANTSLWLDGALEYGAAFPYFSDAQTGANYITNPAACNTAIPANKGKFQLLSAGLDNHYGSYPMHDQGPPPAQNTLPTTLNELKQYPDGLRYDTEDYDNLVNFSGSNLEDSKP